MLSFKALAAKRLPDRSGVGVLVGQVVAARTALSPTGKIFVDGALWEARSSEPIAAGELVEIVGLDGLSVLVRPAPKGA
jgi:membrane-bound serine protease (ClpP class)